MRLTCLLPLLLAACSSSTASSTPTDATSIDVASDSGSETPSYEVSDFESFHWSWYGSGPGGSFSMDRDCGISSSGHHPLFGTPLKGGSGVVAPSDCDDFKVAAVRPEFLGALSAPGDACTGAYDDYSNITVDTRDGEKHELRAGAGCSEGPFKVVYDKIASLCDKYAVSDAGSD